jgi:Mg-chelatase subunit ChlD
MNSDSQKNSAQEFEAKLTALLLGELPTEEAEALRQKIAQDTDLAKMHSRLKATIQLVKETVASPEEQAEAQPATLKLSEDRREKLLAHFKTIKPKEFAKAERTRFTWEQVAAIAAVIAVIGALAGLLFNGDQKAYRSFSGTRGVYGLQSQEAANLPASLPQPTSSDGFVVVNSDVAGLDRSRELSQPPMGSVIQSSPLNRTAIVLPGAGERRTSEVAMNDAEPLGLLEKRGILAPPAQAPIAGETPSGNFSYNALGLTGVQSKEVAQKDSLFDVSRQPSATLASTAGASSSFQAATAPGQAGAVGGHGFFGGGGGGGVGGGAPVAAPPPPASAPSAPGAATPTTIVLPTAAPEVASAATPPTDSLTAGAKVELNAKFDDVPADNSKKLDFNWKQGNELAKNEPAAQAGIPEGAKLAEQAGPEVVLNGVTTLPGEKKEALKVSSVDAAQEEAIREAVMRQGPVMTLEKVQQDRKSGKSTVISQDNSMTSSAVTSGIATETNYAAFGITTPAAETPATPPVDPATGLPLASATARPMNGWATDSMDHAPQNAAIVPGTLPLFQTNMPALGDSLSQGSNLNPPQAGTYAINTSDDADVAAKLNDLFKGTKSQTDAQTRSDAERRYSYIRGEATKSAGGLGSSAAPESTTATSANLVSDGRLLYEMGKPVEAQKKLQEALEQDPNNQAAHYYLDLAGKAMNKPEPKKTHEVASLQQSLSQAGAIVLPESDGKNTSTPVYSLNIAGYANISTNGGVPLQNNPLDNDDREKRAVPTFGTADKLSEKQLADVRGTEGVNANQRYLEAKRKLEELQRSGQILSYKINSEGTDVLLPKTAMVEIIDQAVPPAAPGAIRRAFGGKVASTARVKVERDQSDITGLSSPAALSGYDPYFIQTESEVIQSEAILGKVVDNLKLNETWAKKQDGRNLTKDETVALLKKNLDLSPVKNTDLLEIRYKSTDPDEAAKVANAVAEAYRDHRVEQRKELTMAGIQALKQGSAQIEQKIKAAQAEVDRLAGELQPSKTPQPDAAPARPTVPAPIPQPEILTRENAFSTFSLNVSDVSFKLAQASLEKGVLPEVATIRSEEFINAFDYRDPEPGPGAPMGFAWERARYPFAQNRDLLRFSVKTAAQGRQAGQPLNLVLLLDSSGSMERADRVRIIREALRVLAGQLQPQDTFSVVTFARTARLFADGVPGNQAGKVAEDVSGLTPEGGTNLEDAMNLAYQTALRHYLANGINRVVLVTDGAANLGNVEPESLKQKVEANRKQGIALDCFGIGWDGYNDDLLEVLSRSGNGRYGFINTPEEAASGFAGQLAGALHVAAADVKVQVEFNPNRVTSYRQLGYAKHQLTKEQFRDNTVAAAQIGAAESGNALYVVEINPTGDGPLGTVHVRYKVPGTTDYREQEWTVPYTGTAGPFEQASPAMRLAGTASAFSEWLAASPYATEVTPDRLLGYLSGVPEVYGADTRPKALEWMIRQAQSLAGSQNPGATTQKPPGKSAKSDN